MAKFNLNLRCPSADRETPIHLIVRWLKKRLVYSTQENIKPKDWETVKTKRNFQRAKVQYRGHPELNLRLDWIIATAKNAFRQFVNDNHRQPEVSELMELLDMKLRMKNEKAKTKVDLFGFIEQFIDRAKTRSNGETGKPLALGTIRIYTRAFAVLKEYATRKRIRVDFDTIDLQFYFDYTNFLAEECGFANNTVGRHVKTLKAFLNDATERGINTNIAFKSKRFKVLSESSSSVYLNEEELEEMFRLDLSSNARLERVRSLFLVGCWSGLRFSDFNSIQPENIQGDYISLTTRKTGEPVAIPIHKTIRLIMERYKGRYPNSLPPPISNVKMNKYLKEIGKMMECLHVEVQTSITRGGKSIVTKSKKYELIVTHTARRSFATNLYKGGLAPIAIMKITGHRTPRAFLTYIKVTEFENAKILKAHWEKKESQSAA